MTESGSRGVKTYRLVLIGFGNVGQAVAQILRDRGTGLAQRYGAAFVITAVSDLGGSVYDPNGLDPAALLEAVKAGGLEHLDAPEHGWDALKTINGSNAEVVLELSFTDLKTGEPASSHVKAALEAGKHVVMTNKGPIALHYAELARLAKAKGLELGFEGTVMSGTPALRMGTEMLAGAGVQRVQGILNGTTNYILTRMEAGLGYDCALREAQERGYAEADPTGDVEGHDATGKVVILANVLMNTPLTMNDVERRGITQVTPEDIAEAKAAGERWKLIGQVAKTPAGVKASVAPQRLPGDHPLAAIGGATNAITYTTELLGEVTLVGPGAGRLETGYALIEDLLAVHRASSREEG
jgi:homoserine dehydrogenase